MRRGAASRNVCVACLPACFLLTQARQSPARQPVRPYAWLTRLDRTTSCALVTLNLSPPRPTFRLTVPVRRYVTSSQEQKYRVTIRVSSKKLLVLVTVLLTFYLWSARWVKEHRGRLSQSFACRDSNASQDRENSWPGIVTQGLGNRLCLTCPVLL